jgi:hypothetical protein
MKKTIFIFLLFFVSCTNTKSRDSNFTSIPLSQEFKSYWFDGTAEISSYKLDQSRYGANREGSAVLIFVTEDFLPKEQVKANQKSEVTYSILKLNRTKKFITGIYPYSIMTSVFSRLGEIKPMVKTTTSIQEWCGQAYLQLNRRADIAITSHSYFQGEADQNFNFKDALTEEELWMWVRTQPDQLPLGTFETLPALEYLRLKHKPIKLYNAEMVLEQKDSLNTYSITYPELQRKLKIHYNPEAPFHIMGWTEIDLKNLDQTTSAYIKKIIKVPYWKLNKLGDESFRDSLGLK